VARSRGFTLVEAIVGMALASVVAGIGTVEMVELLGSARLAGAARTTAGTLRLARGMAIARGAGVEVRFDRMAGTYELRDRNSAVLQAHRLPVGVAFAALPARGRLNFGGLGTADNGTVVLAAGTRTRSVVVNQRGRVRVQ
jgi:prepilin-type N-terminal cleavage/methylation domain-containing protein